MSQSIRVAAIQLRAHDRAAFARAFDVVVEATRRAVGGCDLVVLPEATLPAYVLGTAALDPAPIDDALQRLQAIAASSQTAIVCGAAAAVGDEVRNAAFVIDRDGSLAGRADKLFLWHFDRRWFAAAQCVEPIPTALGRLGVLICADGRIPTIARALVDRGAVALVMPTAWVTSGRDPGSLENVQADLLARVRAYENRVPFVAANKCGSELGMVAYCGKSQVVDARGEIVAMAGEREPETIYATIALQAANPPRVTMPQLGPRRLATDRKMRVAISPDALPDDIDEGLAILDDDFALAPGAQGRFDALDRIVPSVRADDALVLDPGGLAAYRRCGYGLAWWTTRLGAPWSERIARARATELRLYVVVVDRALDRAFVVDPDGAVVAGTFDGYRIASFQLDPGKIRETAVAPGTDVSDGLELAARIIDDA